ncbi:MAG TPA: protein translocase subunit SecF, partial [Oligoflexia bacterium]|nr:protein translocase subunit SecF [Oligoflexia bacterium]
MLRIVPKNTNIDFMGKRYIWVAISTIAVLGSILLVFTKGLNYGIDFTGGAEVQLAFQNSVSVGELRELMDQGGFKSTRIQRLGGDTSKEFLVKFQGEESDLQQVGSRVSAALSAKIAPTSFEVLRVDVVGPQAGGELRKSGFLSMFYALLCILIYVAIRFDVRYAPGAVVALFHDSIITIGIFVLLQKEFSLQIVAAILAVIGYSNNDTIIVYDRIRETLRNYPGRPLLENVNRSINETLSRTILTS